MNRLIVFYDAECPFCRWCREWVEAQPAYVPVEFHPHRAAQTHARYPTLADHAPEENLVVFTDTGLVYLGDHAWVMILWALRDWRAWSLRLGEPALRPLTRKLWGLLHRNRGRLGWFLRLDPREGQEVLHRDPAASERLCDLPSP